MIYDYDYDIWWILNKNKIVIKKCWENTLDRYLDLVTKANNFQHQNFTITIYGIFWNLILIVIGPTTKLNPASGRESFT